MANTDAGLISRVNDMWIDNLFLDAGLSRGVADMVGVGVIFLSYAVLINGVGDMLGACLI